MTKLVTGRVIKVPSANVSADRYQFIQLSETEPDLGLPSQLGQVPTSDLSGNRSWVTLSTDNISEGSNLFYTNARVLANVSAMSINVLADVDITGIQNNGILIWNGTQFTAGSVSASATSNTALFAYVAAVANTALTANVANSVISLAGHTTSEIAEGSNLYFTTTRVVSTVTPLLTTANVVETTNQYFTNARVVTAVTPLLTAANIVNFDSRANAVIYPSLNTANVTETAGNLYFTAARVNAVVQPFLTTANVIEVSSNLYFSNARANAVIWPSLTAANIANFDSRANAVIYPSLTTANVTESSGNLYFTAARVLSYLTTANVVETSANLYFTTARVNATVQPFLTTANVIETNGNLYFTTARVNATVQPFLTTANVVESASNLYFTPARILSYLTTANVTETGSNVYFTNVRAVIAVQSILTTANVRELGNLYYTDARVNTAVRPILTTANVTESASNLYFTTARVNAVIQPFLTTANVTESASNLYFTTARVVSTVTPLLTTANVVESANNLYFTNARVLVGITTGTVAGNINVTGTVTANTVVATTAVFGSGTGGSLTGANLLSSEYIQANNWLGLYTANVVETAGNLYFTNSRVVSALVAGDGIIIEANGRISANLSAALANVGASFATQFANLTTAQVVEVSSNLYFTNARARSVFSAGDNIIIEANGRISANIQVSIANLNYTIANLTTASIVEAPSNLYFTYARVNATVQPFLTTANVRELGNLYYTDARVNVAIRPILTTANVIETSGNLYFTNTRARAVLSAGTGVTYDAGNGIISIGQDVSTTANVTFRNLIVTNNLTVYGGVETFQANNLVISDNMIYLNNGSQYSNPDVGFAFNYNDGIYHHAGFFRDHSDGTFKVFDNYSPEPDANIFINTAHASFRIANIAATTFFGNVSGTVGSLSNHTTTDLAEGTNLYYTNSRVRSALSGGTGVVYDSTAGSIAIGQNVATTANVQFNNVTTQLINPIAGDIFFGGNIIPAQNAVFNFGSPTKVWKDFYLSATSLFVGNTKVSSNADTGGLAVTTATGQATDLSAANVFVSGLVYGDVFGRVSNLYNHTTGNLNEGINLYYTNARVIAAVTPTHTTANIIEISSNLYFTAARVNVVVQPFFTTANITETSGNLYFTAARVNTVVQPFLTTANVTESLNNLYYTNSRVVSAVTPLFTTANVIETSSNLYFTAARVNTVVQPFLTTANVVESVSNLYFTNARVSSNVITLMKSFQGSGVSIDAANGQINITTIASAPQANTANFANTAGTANTVLSLSNFTTANLAEGTNLYFTNARVAANVITLMKSFQGTGLTIDAANGQINILASASAPTANVANFATVANFANTAGFANTATTANTVLTLSNFTTANLAEGVNLYYTNSRVISAVTPLLTTANVIESTSNLYFTYARANAAIWPSLTTANVSETAGNLYFTAARVNTVIQPFLTTANVIETSSNLYFTYARANATVWPSLTAANIANFDSRANAVIWPSLNTANVTETAGNLYFTTARVIATVTPTHTTANIVELNNLYYTNARTRSAFTAGKGISISGDGVIKNTGSTSQYNLDINGTAGGNVLSTMSPILTFPSSNSTDRFLLRSIHVVNTSGATAQISGNILYATGNTAPIANLIPIAQGGVMEFIKTYQLFQPGDVINLQGSNAAGTATANLMTAMLTYETYTNDPSFIGIGQVVASADTNTLVYDSPQSYSIIESIKFVNLQSSVVPVRAYWGDANGVPLAYLAYGLQIPTNSSVELLQSPKRINQNDRIYVSYSGAPAGAVSVFVSARLGSVYTSGPSVSSAPPGNTLSMSFSTTGAEGTVLYYTLE